MRFILPTNHEQLGQILQIGARTHRYKATVLRRSWPCRRTYTTLIPWKNGWWERRLCWIERHDDLLFWWRPL